MKRKYAFWVLLTLICVFAPLASTPAFADTLSGTPTTDAAGNTGPNATNSCPQGNAIQTQAANNQSAHAQQVFNRMHAINTMFPIQPALSACVQKLTNLISELPTMGNPFGMGDAIIAAVINSVVSQACSAAMSEITSVQTSLINLTKICIPMPHFGSLDLPTWSASTCSGGIAISPLTSFSSTSPTATYSYQQYLH